ncbi:uncharacterized protein EDB91DRAFT_1265724 [Suillus paluster]|uniref:uncharacterized protein n=1 Tax=Suillus paluster TaxID=48578 RepID=UPI001B882692|nr:uncharacterized protein EDB91DRAFT_1265724 [Suillus paluster]KAG1725569.1 hypothetical protein EDB91DRAFT_1265724 [Suillus paluster]
MAMKHGCRSHALIVRQKTPHACPHNVLLGRIRHLQDLRDIRTRRRGKDEHNARRATNTVFTSILTSRQLAHGEAPSEDSPICSPNSLKRRRGIAGASEAPPLARRCKVDRKESVTIHAGYLRLPWDAWMKAQRFATTRQSNFNPGGLAHMNIGSDPIIHAEYVRRLLHGELYDDYDETPSRGAKRERSHVGCRKVSVESWNPSPSKKIRISRRQRREPRQYPRAIPLPTHRRRKHVNPGVVRSGSERTSRSPIDVPGPVPKRILPSDSTLPACSQMVAMLKRASAHICEIQEQERIIPRTVIYQESTSKQPRFIEFPAMATDDEPSIRAGGADIATSSAPSVIVGLGDSFNAVPVPTLDIQMCVLSLADRDAEMFAATRLNDDLRKRHFS